MATTPTTPPQPPRLSGDLTKDMQAIIQWLWDFYKSAIVQGFFLSVANQGQGGGDEQPPPNLPDPANTNLAQAQKTANDASIVAQSAMQKASKTDGWVTGSLTITAGASTATHNFATAQTDTNYRVFATATGFTGTPTISSFPIIRVTKATANFTLEVSVAPGVGNSVTFDFIVTRNI